MQPALASWSRNRSHQWQHATSTTSPRHLFVSQNLGTLITHSNYNKTTALTGQYSIFCELSLCSFSHPHKAPAHSSSRRDACFASNAPAGDRLEIQNTYATYIFVSHGKVWNSARLSASLRSWFLRELKVPFGLQLHRHFAQALQRRFLSYKRTNELYKTANDVMGHGSEVADHHYARETDDLNLDTSERHRMEQVGVDWITKNAFNTLYTHSLFTLVPVLWILPASTSHHHSRLVTRHRRHQVACQRHTLADLAMAPTPGPCPNMPLQTRKMLFVQQAECDQ
ncbi:hypothetical protein JVU11DRAFT_12724 [Chiua virens]|nr:hypothetical protein JVU11DRAFT_12724 [Chiua virens]